MMKRLLYIFFACLILSVFYSCKDKKEQIDAGYTYFPLSTGEYRIYNVEKISYGSLDTITEQFQIKERVAEPFTINGENRYRIERYKRMLENDPWPSTPDSVWSAFVTSSRAVKIENNNRYVKLVFPVEDGKQWNGNVENSKGEETYTLSKTGKSYSVLNKLYPETARVLHRLDTSYVSKDYREEVFGKGVGMIYKIQEQYKYSQAPSDWRKYVIQSGTKYEEKLSSYGQE